MSFGRGSHGNGSHRSLLKTGNPLALGLSRTQDGTVIYNVQAVQFEGQNVSGHPLHQVYGEITLHRDQRKLPLFITADGMWVPTDDVDTIPARARFYLGASFRVDGHHWSDFDQQMTPEQFLKNFGGFSVEIFIDGTRQSWSFSIDQLRNVINAIQERRRGPLVQHEPTGGSP